jgi:glycosyltransferase involved in cell wall biosynthesis
LNVFSLPPDELRLEKKELEMTDKPLVSIIIPAFNAARYIRQALNSVLAQTYPAIEVIVVDDGSSDATSAIVEEYVTSDARIQLVRQSNMGVGTARNTAIRKARGKYIAPLDADDFWLPEKLEKQVTRMEQCGSETGLVYCWSTLIDEEGEFLGLSYPHQAVGGRLRHALVFRNVIDNASAPLFRAAALEKVGVYITRAEQGGAQGCEDWDLHLRIAEFFNVRLVPEYLVAYRQTRSSMTTNAKSMAASYAVVSRRARQRNRDLPSATFRWAAGHFYCYLAKKCYLWHQYSCCLCHLRKAVCADPALLLNTWICKILIKASLKAVTGSKVKRVAELVRPSPNGEGKEAERLPQRESKRPSILDGLFERIELKRWSAVLHDGA